MPLSGVVFFLDAFNHSQTPKSQKVDHSAILRKCNPYQVYFEDECQQEEDSNISLVKNYTLFSWKTVLIFISIYNFI